NVEDAIRDISKHEGKLDLMPIPFNKKIDILLSKYSKLQLSKSTNNFVIFFNLINGDKRLENKDVRIALNQALDQENLVNFVYKKEGSISPFTASINYDIVKKIAKENSYKEKKFSQNEIKKLLDNLELKVFTQDRFMFLWKVIEFQLKKYNVKLIYTITNSEKDIYNQLLKTSSRKNTKEWDMLIWGDDDWYYGDPWTVFFIYEINSVWSTIKEDNLMKEYIKEYFTAKRGTTSYENITKKILFRAKSMAYTLRVPSPNKVMALNKEVIFKPYMGAMLPLWNIDITKDHWSIRKKRKYPQNLEQAIKVKR
ncbi:MAG: ABC transporter substrate-binding protein, partial [Campylobacteraceae bacterium]|nr:ABC transporter substrate-binding protein [Campylobacteraceae bacterium]